MFFEYCMYCIHTVLKYFNASYTVAALVLPTMNRPVRTISVLLHDFDVLLTFLTGSNMLYVYGYVGTCRYSAGLMHPPHYLTATRNATCSRWRFFVPRFLSHEGCVSFSRFQICLSTCFLAARSARHDGVSPDHAASSKYSLLSVRYHFFLSGFYVFVV